MTIMMQSLSFTKDRLQLLVLQLAFELLRLGHLPYCLVEVVLGDRIPVVLDSEQTTITC